MSTLRRGSRSGKRETGAKGATSVRVRRSGFEPPKTLNCEPHLHPSRLSRKSRVSRSARPSGCARWMLFCIRYGCAGYPFSASSLPDPGSRVGCRGTVRCDVDELLAFLKPRPRDDGVLSSLDRSASIRSQHSWSDTQLSGCVRPEAVCDNRCSIAGYAQA